uniref:Uncharacterized protein n=1 Tax=Nonomuraea gerenzanensis TaxID=93944 RepID=A0A1M4E8N4_9ACTN|nr:hypothetical protein BN4615_P4640 [Nonomuraea gerenzanensis]
MRLPLWDSLRRRMPGRAVSGVVPSDRTALSREYANDGE